MDIDDHEGQLPIAPFRIPVDNAEIEDLRGRLERTRWPDHVNDGEWSWGVSETFLRGLASGWAAFDWVRRVSEFNELPQFRAELDGFGLHFFHFQADDGDRGARVPIILLHGWPGSFAEMLELVPELRKRASAIGVALDIVVPSIPGFGYSSRAAAPGVSPAVVARLFHRLMTGLGYARYAVHGGDIGAGIAIRMAKSEPNAVMALHLNLASFVFAEAVDEPPDSVGRASDARREAWFQDHGGYKHLHATRPQTLGYALADSPVGLAAWISERFFAWTDRRSSQGAIPIATKDILTDLSIYWFSQTITSSMRIYKESAADPLVLSANQKIPVPTAVASFPCEVPMQPRQRIDLVTNLVRWTEMSRGGHFAALEAPDLLAEDIVAFLKDS